MSRIIRFMDKGVSHMLILQEGDLAILEKLKHRKSGSVPVTISAASRDGDVVHIYVPKKKQGYSIPASDLFG